MLTPRRPDLRGACERMSKELAEKDPTLTVVRGWYIDAMWGEQEHWWLKDQNGEIIDPTVEQFPTGHIPHLRQYREHEGLYPCPGCGIPTTEEGYCCGPCYGSDVGIYGGGRCRCGTDNAQTNESENQHV